MGDPVYRLPRYFPGPKIMLANELEDRVPWSITDRGANQWWNTTQGEGVTVAILDTGLWRHPDLPEPAFAVNFSRSRSIYDAVGHGTHVAGTVGARKDGRGVVGWAPKCNIGCVKVLGDDGTGDEQAIANGIYYAANAGADIINMSLGGGYSAVIEKACQDVVQMGKILIVAAGNEGDGQGVNTMGYPARLNCTIAIGSYRQDGKISDYSSRGPEIDFAFPGENILSTWLDGTYREISGTSMATPGGAGTTALMLSANRKARAGGVLVPALRTNSELLAVWQRNSQDRGESGFDHAFGHGILDVAGAMRDVTVPSAPTPPTPPPTQPGPPQPPPGLDGITLAGIGFAVTEIGGKTGVFIYPNSKN